jgi:hypothetical protein
MVAKLTGLTHKKAVQLHLVAESWIICGSRYRRPVRKLLDTSSYEKMHTKFGPKTTTEETIRET